MTQALRKLFASLSGVCNSLTEFLHPGRVSMESTDDLSDAEMPLCRHKRNQMSSYVLHQAQICIFLRKVFSRSPNFIFLMFKNQKNCAKVFLLKIPGSHVFQGHGRSNYCLRNISMSNHTDFLTLQVALLRAFGHGFLGEILRANIHRIDSKFHEKVLRAVNYLTDFLSGVLSHWTIPKISIGFHSPSPGVRHFLFVRHFSPPLGMRDRWFEFLCRFRHI